MLNRKWITFEWVNVTLHQTQLVLWYVQNCDNIIIWIDNSWFFFRLKNIPIFLAVQTILIWAEAHVKLLILGSNDKNEKNIFFSLKYFEILVLVFIIKNLCIVSPHIIFN